MGLFTTKNFFFCLSLKTGGLALSILVLLSSILATMDLTYKLGRDYFRQIPSYEYEYGYRYGYSSYTLKDLMFMAGLLVFFEIILFVSIAWLYGIFKKKASWMIGFVIYTFLSLVALIGFFLVFFVSFFIPLPHPFYLSRDRDSWVYLVPALPLIVLQWHLTATIYSLYKNVKAENNCKPGTLYPIIGNKA